MKARLKLLLYYISELILSVSVFCLVLIVILKITILNPNYILSQFEKNNYYEKLSDSIKTEMTYYTDQSGLDDSVLNDLYTKEIIEEETKVFIDNLYHDSNKNINTDMLKENILNNIDEYLKNNNLKIEDQESLDLFLNDILDIYKNRITFSGKLYALTNKIIKINKIVIIAIIILTIIILLLLFVIKKIFHKNILGVSVITTSLLIFLSNFLFFRNIDINHIVIWNENVSVLIKNIIKSISSYTIVTAVILIVLAIINISIKILKNK